MKEITYNGKKIPAYNLLMRRENALDILHGKKVVETRCPSARYDKMFLDPEIVAANTKAMEEGRLEDWQMDMRTDVGAIHFYSTGAPWTLDVLIDEVGTVFLNDEGIKFMQENFNFHDFDDELGKNNDLPADEIPWVYWFHIGKVVAASGLE
jgi:hypothetical protein